MEDIEYKSIYNQIKKASESNQLVVFIGAGMSNNFGFPTWNGLVREMYKELTGKEAAKGKAFSSDELLRIPQALREKNKVAFERILKECFGAQRVVNSENAILDEIMKLKPKHIITTNFDTLIEKYLQDKEEALNKSHSAKEGYAKLVNNHIPYRYMLVIKDRDMVTADANHLLLKIHGDVQNMDSLVLCEDDYLEYSDSHILMENFIKSLLINHTFLFVGYGVGDSNLKMIMKWVENIVSRQKADGSKRKKHILLYTENKAMDEFQKKYLEQKQIQVLEFCKLPQAYRKQPVTEFTDEKGKHLLAMLRAIVPSEKDSKIDDEKLKEIFAFFENRKVVHIWEVAEFVDKSRYEFEKEGSRMRLIKGTFGHSFMETIFRVARRKKGGQLVTDARAFLGKIGIDEYCCDREDKEFKVLFQYDGFMEEACLTSNYNELYNYVKRRDEYSYVEKAHWAMYVDDKKEADKWLEKQWNSKIKMDLYEQLRFAHNVQQEYTLQGKYGIDFGVLWASLPDEERKHQVLIHEYMTGCKELYHEFGEVSDKLRLRCYARNASGGIHYEIERFAICRTAVLDFVRTMVLNGFYITGLWPCTYLHGNFSDLIRLYVDMILFLISPECKRKQEWFRLCPWDIYILINLIEQNELPHLLGKYKITQLKIENSVQESLIRNCMNLLCFSEKRLVKKNARGHLCSRRIKNCMALMDLVSWDREHITPLIDEIFGYLEKLMPLDRNERVFFAPGNIFYSFMEKQYMNGHEEMISPYAEDLFKSLLRKFLREDHLNQYSKILEDNAEWYHDIEALSALIDKEKNRISGNLIAQCWNCYQAWYQGSTSQLLADIYPFATKKVQLEISEFVYKKLKGTKMILLRTYMEMDIIRYTSEVETELLDRCQRFSNLPEKQRGKSGNNESPLTHILRLWQNGKIPQIEVFRGFKSIDPWFSFVCFPEEFDYENFEVEGWCTWLSVERYRGEAFQKNRELLKEKFQKAMDAGAGEDVRRIYYKYVE